MNHTLEMIAAQYELHVREQVRRRRPHDDDDVETSGQRRRAKSSHRVAGAPDPNEL